MKTITTIAASMMLMATTASAAVTYYDASGNTTTENEAYWEGVEDETVLPDMCRFIQNTSGDMDLDSNKRDWTTATNGEANVTVEFRGVHTITVDAKPAPAAAVGPGSNGAILDDAYWNMAGPGKFNAAVTYEGSSMDVTYDGTSTTVQGSLASDDKSFSWTSPQTVSSPLSYIYTAGKAVIKIAGSAKPTATSVIYNANAEYRVWHRITCIN